ncbi:unnamed protein product [Musa textilis]
MLAQDHVNSAGLDSIPHAPAYGAMWDLFSIALWEKSDLLYSRPRIKRN